MSPADYLAAIKQLGLNQSEAGLFLGVHPVTGRRWAKFGPPTPVGKFLRFMIALKLTPAYVDLMLSIDD